jgi:hypothetical protein
MVEGQARRGLLVSKGWVQAVALLLFTENPRRYPLSAAR